MKKHLIFLDNRFVSVDTKRVSSLAPGLLSGKGVFETMRVTNGKIALVEAHFDRMARGLKTMNIANPYSVDEFKKIIVSTLNRNGLKNARIRFTVWCHGGTSRVSVVTAATVHYSSRDIERGFKAITSKLTHHKGRFAGCKSIDYLLFLKAAREAELQKYDEAILLDQQGRVVEGARSNIFFVKNNSVFTPAVKLGCLNGITRRTVLHVLRKMGVKVKVGVFSANDVLDADEAFVTNSIIEVMPLRVLDAKAIGGHRIGPLTLKILKKYRQYVQEIDK